MKIGILGNGQLGQMLADSVTDLGDLEVNLYDLKQHSNDQLRSFLNQADVISYETENISAEIVAQLDSMTAKIHPNINTLKTFQNRLLEKQALRSAGIATADFCPVHSLNDVTQAIDMLGLPLILKTTTEGYDGKGQYLLESEQDAGHAWQTLGQRELIAEAFVSFLREISIIACRDQSGHINIWPMTENIHSGGILRYSLYPASNLPASKQQQAKRYITGLLESLEYVGTITLELFETKDGLVANEVAPRVHNSGHWSIEGADTSQFRNHILAISGRNITPVHAKYPAIAMLNIIGEESSALAADKLDNVFRHSYHKEARPGRKLGHITVLADHINKRDLTIDNLSQVLPKGIWPLQLKDSSHG